MKELEKMRVELKELAEQEAYKLWKLARRAEAHGISPVTVFAIREEASEMYTTMTTYPDRLLDWKFPYNHKYAFKY